MAAVDLFCAPDDQHRVVLLVDLLKAAGRTVVLRPEPVAAPSNPCIVAWTHRALKEPWITSLFGTAPTLVALRLDDTPLPGPCARSIGLQNWPARSADRKVGALVDWLLRHGPRLEVAGAAESDGAPPRHPPAAGVTDRPKRRRPRDERAAETWRNLTVLAFLAVGGLLLWWAVPERNGAMGPAPEHEPGLAAGSGDPLQGVSAASGSADPDSAPMAGDDPMSPRMAGADTAQRAPGAPQSGLTYAEEAPAVPAHSQAVTISDDLLREQVPAHPDATDPAVLPTRRQPPPERPAAGAAPPAAVPSAARSDALAHLCEARTLAAASAWAGTLDWKQRRRLPTEPCVARLLARPGFEGLASLLQRS